MSTPVRTLTRTIAEGSTWLTVSTVTAKVLGVATTLLVLASLTVFEYGTSKLMLSVMGVFAIFSLPGLTEIVVADMGIEKGQGRLTSARNLLNQFFFYNLSLGIAAFLVMFFGADLIAVHMDNAYVAQMLRVLSFLFLIGPFRSAAYILWRTQHNFGTQSMHRVFESIVKLGLTFYLVTALQLNVYGYILTYTLTDFIGMAPFLWPALRAYRTLGGTHETKCLSLWQSLLGHGKWAVAQGYLHSVVQSGRLWIIKLILGTEAVGLYSAAFGIYQHVVGVLPLKYVLSSIIPQYLPASDTFRKLIVKGVKYSIVSGVILAVVAAVSVPVLVHFLLPQYQDAIGLFELMLISILPGAASGVFTVVFFAIRQQRDMFWVNVWLSAMTFVLLPLALFSFGIYGTVVEITAVAVLFTVERYRRIRKVLPSLSLEWRAFFTYDEFDRKILGKVAERIPYVKK